MPSFPRAYLSYPIQGHDVDVVREKALQRKESIERAVFWRVVNPMEVPACAVCGKDDHTHTWNEFMQADLIALLTCRNIVMCDGWETSRGACAELATALTAGIRPWLYVDRPNYGKPALIDMTNGTRVEL